MIASLPATACCSERISCCGTIESLPRFETERILRAPLRDGLPPFIEPLCLEYVFAEFSLQRIEQFPAVAHQGYIRPDDLFDRGLERRCAGWIFLAPGQNSLRLPGHAVIEAGLYAYDQVGRVHRQIGFQRAMHARHAQILLVGRRVGTEPHQGQGTRRAGTLHESRKGGACSRA